MREQHLHLLALLAGDEPLVLQRRRVEIDFNTVESSIRPLALDRKNALFAGSGQGGDDWAVIASLIKTCKLNRVDPQAWRRRRAARQPHGAAAAPPETTDAEAAVVSSIFGARTSPVAVNRCPRPTHRVQVRRHAPQRS